jgi:hypothetical protein
VYESAEVVRAFAPLDAEDAEAWGAAHEHINALGRILVRRGVDMFERGDDATEGRFVREIAPLLVRDIVAMLFAADCGRETVAAMAPYLVAEFATAPHHCNYEREMAKAREMLARTAPQDD